jgi:signal transduction histidine kinase
MHIRWWQSIHWRLVVGSVLVTFLATALLALTIIVAVIYLYSSDQQNRTSELAAARAQQIGLEYTRIKQQVQQKRQVYTVPGLLRRASTAVLPQVSLRNIQDQQYLLAVIAPRNMVVYPQLSQKNSSTVATFLVRLADTSQQKGDAARLSAAIQKAYHGTTTTEQLGRGLLSQPFTVQPIFEEGDNNGAIVGALFVAPRSAVERTLPPFIATVGSAVFFATLTVALIAACAAILFARSITRPLAKLSGASRKMATGDYSARVEAGPHSELNELAETFNEMAAQLQRDVEELRRQEAWRRELLMSITHDLATPLTAITGLGEALVDGVNQSREDYEATGRIIVRETLRLRRLVQDLHMMAKVEAGALHPQRRAVRLAAFVDEILAVLIPAFEQEHVEPCNAISYQLPAVQADPDMLSRVFANLCNNALHYTPAGGTITIEAKQQPDAVVVAVTDTGPGIPPEALSRIFERFYRVDSARQSQTGGSGLGLAIVRAIIEAHGGTVWAENAPDAGARILFTLPLKPAGQPSLSDAPTLPLFKKTQLQP